MTNHPMQPAPEQFGEWLVEACKQIQSGRPGDIENKSDSLKRALSNIKLFWSDFENQCSIPISVLQKIVEILDIANENAKELIEISNQKYEQNPSLRIEREIKSYIKDRDNTSDILTILKTKFNI